MAIPPDAATPDRQPPTAGTRSRESNDRRPGQAECRIELRLRELNQLFDSFDPAPFHEKDLDRDAEEFIVSWALEHPPAAPLLFRLHLPRDQQRLQPERVVQDAVRNYFTYRSGIARLDVRRTLQYGRQSLLIGMLFLIACMALRAYQKSRSPAMRFTGTW